MSGVNPDEAMNELFTRNAGLLERAVEEMNEKPMSQLFDMVSLGVMKHADVESGDEPDMFMASQQTYGPEEHDLSDFNEDNNMLSIAGENIIAGLVNARNQLESHGDYDERSFGRRILESAVALSLISPERSADVRDKLGEISPTLVELLDNLKSQTAEYKSRDSWQNYLLGSVLGRTPLPLINTMPEHTLSELDAARAMVSMGDRDATGGKKRHNKRTKNGGKKSHKGTKKHRRQNKKHRSTKKRVGRKH